MRSSTKTAVVLSIAILANSFGNVLLSMGMRRLPPALLPDQSWLAHTASHIISNPHMIAGVLLLIIFLSAYLTALSWADLSFVLPATAPAYILTALLAHYFLGEAISGWRWAGTAMIIIGTFLVAGGGASTTTVSPTAAGTAKSSRTT